MVKKLPEAELFVMSVIWDATESIATTEIARIVNERYHREWTSSTIQSLLNRLSARGFLSSKRIGKYKYYTAVAGKEEYCTEEIADFVSIHYGGSVFDLVTTLYKNKALTKNEVDKLRDMLNRDEWSD